MLIVKLNTSTDMVEVSFKYAQEYIDRIKKNPYMTWNNDIKCWQIPSLLFNTFEREFRGEIVYATPKWVIEGTIPPDYSNIFKNISKIHVPLKPPYEAKKFQIFGANFLYTQAKKFKIGCLFDDMGTGSFNL